MNVLSAWGNRLHALADQSGPYLAAAATVSALPLDCKLAFDQTVHICVGWTPPVAWLPGLAPFPMCWAWLGLGFLFGVVLTVFLVVFVLLLMLVRSLWINRRAERHAVAPPLVDAGHVAPDLRVETHGALARLGDTHQPTQQRSRQHAPDMPVFMNAQMSEEARLELLQLLVQGGNELLHALARERGVVPEEFLRQVAGRRRRVGPSRSPSSL